MRRLEQAHGAGAGADAYSPPPHAADANRLVLAGCCIAFASAAMHACCAWDGYLLSVGVLAWLKHLLVCRCREASVEGWCLGDRCYQCTVAALAQVLNLLEVACVCVHETV